MRILACTALVLSVAGCRPHTQAESGAHDERSYSVRAEVEFEARTDEPALEQFDGEPPAGRALLLSSDRGRKVGLPLLAAEYDSFVVGTVAETQVKQRYHNPLDRTLDAVYVFPLPHDGAVFDYSIRVQDRSVRGEMKRRAEARAAYEQARQSGHTAGLLEQERPNVFTHRLANIPPGETIEVELRVVQPLARDDGRYELVLPTVVGPRYVPGGPVGLIPAGSFAPDTDRVPDGSRISPALQPSGEPAPANVAIQVAIERGELVAELRSTHHDVDVHTQDGVTRVALTAGVTQANRDFVLSWREASEQPLATLMLQPELEGGGYFTLTIEPPRALAHEAAIPRELVFVVDTSGSMQGAPIETAKQAMREVLRKLGPDDVFQIVRFAQTASTLGRDFLPNRPDALKRGFDFVDAMQSDGGTEISSGLRAALQLPHDPRRLRTILFLTDGFIGNEQEIFREIRERNPEARLFSLGVGTSVNRHLLDGLARLGRGDVSYVSSGEAPDAVVQRFFARIDRPVLADVTIDWGELEVADVEPQRLPDLFMGKPVVVFGRYRGEPAGSIELRAKRGHALERLPVLVDFAHPRASSAALSAMWARSRIARLGDVALSPGDPEEIQEQIIALSLEHHVLTEHTAFVAVDATRQSLPSGDTLHVPLAMPAGMDMLDDLPAKLAKDQAYSNFGFGGLGLRGVGRGGGGVGEGAIGLGAIGTIGHGAGGGAGGFRGRIGTVPRVTLPRLPSGDSYMVVVRRVVARHSNELRFCYEQELNARPDLRGKLVVKLIISPTGTVQASSIKSSTLTHAKLEQCIAQAARRWTFPAPADGGIAIVEFPVELTSNR